jgi:hypothetical protein
MRIVLRTLILLLALTALVPSASWAQARPADRFEPGELVETGHRFFGGVSRGLATIIEKAVSQWGLPNGYVLGEEAGGAFFGGLRYGEGVLYMRRRPQQRIFWQGPSIGFDVGGAGARTMMLVYNMHDMSEMEKRFVELEGQAYVIAGFGLTAATADNIVVVPIRSGVGLRVGVNLGYIKFSRAPTWNPF